MKEFVFYYGGTVCISILVVLAVFFALRKIIKDKKKGKCSCGGDCENCDIRH